MKKISKLLFTSFFVYLLSSCSVYQSTSQDNVKYKKIKNGYHEVTTKNGEYYVGNFKNGLYQGKGLLTLTDGTTFEGNFEKGHLIKGTVFYGDGQSYSGSFKNNKWNGKGFLRKKDGSFYKGNFNNGEISGEGEYYDKTTKTSYVGNFDNGKLNGEVVKQKTNSKPQYAYYNDDGNDIAESHINNKSHEIVNKEYQLTNQRIKNEIKKVSENLTKLNEEKNQYERIKKNPCEEAERVMGILNKVGGNCDRANYEVRFEFSTTGEECILETSRTMTPPVIYIEHYGCYEECEYTTSEGYMRCDYECESRVKAIREAEAKEWEREKWKLRRICDKSVEDFNLKRANPSQLSKRVAQEITRNRRIENSITKKFEAEKRKQVRNRKKDVAKAKKQIKQQINKQLNEHNKREEKFKATCLKRPNICGCEKYLKKDPCKDVKTRGACACEA